MLTEHEATAKRHQEEMVEVRAELEASLKDSLAKVALLESENKSLAEGHEQQKVGDAQGHSGRVGDGR